MLLGVGVRTNKHDPICFDGDRLSSWRFVVGGVNVSVFENNVGRLGTLLHRYQGQQQETRYD
jgi:hypothetical protein